MFASPLRWMALSVALLIPGQALAGQLEDQIFAELNRARTDPRGYIETLKDYRALFEGKLVAYPDRIREITQEGTVAVDDAIAFLRRQEPVVSLYRHDALDAAAADHARDQAGGGVGHTGSDGSTVSQRIRRYGEWHIGAAENIAYGSPTAVAVVRQLIVDDAVPSRGHRLNIFDPTYRMVGVACGPHRQYRVVCVMDFAGAVTERR